MTINTADTLTRGMKILTEQMGILGAETFIYLVKTEGFDYTKWRRGYFEQKSKEEIDKEIELYFAENPCSVDPKKII